MKRSLGQLLAVGATVVFALLFVRTVPWSDTRAQLAALPAGAVLAALLAVLAAMTLTAVRWRFLLGAAGVEVRVPKLFAGLAAGAAINNLVPARGGDVVRVRSVPGRTSAVVGTLAAERLLDGFVLGLFVLFGAALSGQARPLLLVGGGMVAGTALAMGLAAAQPGWLERLPRSLRGFVTGLAVFRAPRLLLGALASSLGLWLADVVVYAVLAPSFGIRLGLGGAFLLEGMGNLALAVPATAAGAGTFDYLTLLAARSVGATGPAAGAYVLTVHAFVVVPATALGLALLWWARPRRAAAPATAAAA